MISDKEQFYYDLYDRFVTNTFAPVALNFAERYISNEFPPNLQYILQSHEENIIRETETHIRDSFDYLLDFYSLVEIAIQSDCLLLPEVESIKIKEILSSKPINKYFTKHYKLLLPTLLLSRLRGEHNLKLLENDNSRVIMSRFLDINSIFQNNYYLDTFLWALDGGSIKGFKLKDLEKLSADPKGFYKSLSKPEKKINGLDEMLIGFKDFLIFCKQFHHFLVDINEYENHRVIQNVYWNYYSYWFKHIKNKTSNFIPIAIRNIQKWGDPDENTDSSFKDMEIVIKELTGHKFDIEIIYDLSKIFIGRKVKTVKVAFTERKGMGKIGTILIQNDKQSLSNLDLDDTLEKTS